MCNQYMEYLNNYFGGKDKEGNEIKPICREERQYALFLYNKILNLVNKRIYDEDDINLLKNLDLDENAKILQVYYEVTFMRDFFFKIKNGKDSYNSNLKCFVKELINNHKSFGFEYDFQYEEYLVTKYMSAMMHCKPDIGIYYNINGKLHLKFIECKYSSPVKPYNLLEGKGKYNIKQYVIQYYITKFICEKLFLNVEAKYPVLVNFVNKKKENKTTNKESICNKCENKLKCNKQDDNCITFISEFIKHNAKYIKLDSLIPFELKNNIN